MSDSPPEKDVQWSEQGMSASYKFIQKFWTLHTVIKSKIKLNEDTSNETFDESVEEFTNQLINKINTNLEKFSYNVIVANLHEIYNFFNKIKDKNYKNLICNYIKILKTMSPIVPHLALECLSEISKNEKILWPEVNEKYLKNKNYNIVIQINGKKRGLFESSVCLEEKELIEKIKKTKEMLKYLENKDIIKSIFIKDKLINLILK